MKVDSAAAEAVNLLPKSDHPSKFGSLYGVLIDVKLNGLSIIREVLCRPYEICIIDLFIRNFFTFSIKMATSAFIG